MGSCSDAGRPNRLADMSKIHLASGVVFVCTLGAPASVVELLQTARRPDSGNSAARPRLQQPLSCNPREIQNFLSWSAKQTRFWNVSTILSPRRCKEAELKFKILQIPLFFSFLFRPAFTTEILSDVADSLTPPRCRHQGCSQTTATKSLHREVHPAPTRATKACAYAGLR